MRRAAVTLVSLTVVVLGLLLGPGFAYHSCSKCEGVKDKTTDTEFTDGDAVLRWRSAQRLEHKAPRPDVPESRCFERGIKNLSLTDLTEVWWKAADFYRKVIFASKDVCDAVGVDGGTSRTTGPITIGPSNAPRYQTQVYAPNNGWPRREAITGPTIFTYANVPPTVFTKENNQTIRLGSGMSVHYYNAKNERAAANIAFTSQVQLASRMSFIYTYTVSHDSADALLVAWSIVNDGVEIRDARRDFRISAPFLVPPGETVTFSIRRDQPPKFGAGPVVVSDRQGRVLARGLASSHGPQSGSIADVPHQSQ